jgi:hypothetical protein
MGTSVIQLIRILSASIAPEFIEDLDATEEEARRKLLVEQIRIGYGRTRILRM